MATVPQINGKKGKGQPPGKKGTARTKYGGQQEKKKFHHSDPRKRAGKSTVKRSSVTRMAQKFKDIGVSEQ